MRALAASTFPRSARLHSGSASRFKVFGTRSVRRVSPTPRALLLPASPWLKVILHPVDHSALVEDLNGAGRGLYSRDDLLFPYGSTTKDPLPASLWFRRKPPTDQTCWKRIKCSPNSHLQRNTILVRGLQHSITSSLRLVKCCLIGDEPQTFLGVFINDRQLVKISRRHSSLYSSPTW